MLFHLADGPEQGLAVRVVDAIIVGDGESCACGVNGEALDLFQRIASHGEEIGESASAVKLAPVMRIALFLSVSFGEIRSADAHLKMNSVTPV